nr:PD40 domain-containing protein [Anaerolineae bacterium]
PVWSPNGQQIVFMSRVSSQNHDLYVINKDGSGLKLVAATESNEIYPVWSPDGQRIAYLATLDGDEFGIYLVDQSGGEPTLLTEGISVDARPSEAFAQISWSPDGQLIAFTGSLEQDNLDILTVDVETGEIQRLTDSSSLDQFPAWSPDGQQIAFTSRRDLSGQDVFVMDADGSNPVQLTSVIADNKALTWSPDGLEIAYISKRENNQDIYVVDVNTGEERRMTSSRGNDFAPSWSPDSSRFAFIAIRSNIADIYTMKRSPSALAPIGRLLNSIENSAIPMNIRAIIALAVTYGAFLAEIFRAGIQSIGRGQMEAARSLGMSYGQAMRYVILPQAIRNVLPALGNDFVAMVKDSSLVSVLAVRDITQIARLYAGRTFRFRESYTTLAVLYLTMVVTLSLLVRLLERRMRKDE